LAQTHGRFIQARGNCPGRDRCGSCGIGGRVACSKHGAERTVSGGARRGSSHRGRAGLRRVRVATTDCGARQCGVTQRLAATGVARAGHGRGHAHLCGHWRDGHEARFRWFVCAFRRQVTAEPAKRPSVPFCQQTQRQDEDSLLRWQQSLGLRAAHGEGTPALAKFRRWPRTVDARRVCATDWRYRSNCNDETKVV